MRRHDETGCGDRLLRAGLAGTRSACPDRPTRRPQPRDSAAQATRQQAVVEIYGFAMLDIGHDFKQIDPDWFDALRPTKLPSFRTSSARTAALSPASGRAGSASSAPRRPTSATSRRPSSSSCSAPAWTPARRRSGCATPGASWQASARARPGARSWTRTSSRTRSSTGARPAWLFFRNVQLRWMPISDGNSTCMVALERPGASGDAGIYADRIELQNIKPRFPSPDLSGALQGWAEVGLRPDRRRSCARSSGTTCCQRPVRSVGQRHRLGHQPQLESQRSARTTVLRLAARLRRRHRELR